jgi:hypothetical protein
MTYRIMVSVDVSARDDRQAADWAKKLDELLKNPMVRVTLEGQGIVVDGQQVYQPQRLPQGTQPARR